MKDRNDIVLTGHLINTVEIKHKDVRTWTEFILKVIDDDGHINLIPVRTSLLTIPTDKDVFKNFRAGRRVTLTGILRVHPNRKSSYIRANEYESIDNTSGDLFGYDQ